MFIFNLVFNNIPNKKYDGIMHDTWMEKNWHYFLHNIKSSLNKNGIVTWYNPDTKDVVEYNCNNLKWGTLTIKEINANPPKNMQYKYFSKKIYYVPKLVL